MRMTDKEHLIAITKHRQQHHKRIMLSKEIYKGTIKVNKVQKAYKTKNQIIDIKLIKSKVQKQKNILVQ